MTQADGRSNRRSTGHWIRLLLIEALAVLALLEVSLRLFHHRGLLLEELYLPGKVERFRAIQTLPELLATTRYGFRPLIGRGDFVLNSRGLKTKEYARAKAPGSTRIIALGDSFTNGSVPYDSIWLVQLERALQEHSDGDVEVLNLGVPAVGPDFELRMWQIEGRALAPDLVVLAFFVGNGFRDAIGEVGDRGLVDRLARASFAFRLARNYFAVARALEDPAEIALGKSAMRKAPYESGGYRLPDIDRETDLLKPTFTPEAFHEIEVRRLWTCDRTRQAEFDLVFERVSGFLTTLHGEVEQAGARLVVMLIPDEYQVDDELQASLLEQEGRSADTFDFEAPQRRLGVLLASLGVPTLDLLQPFREAGASARLYRLRNTHWNVEGNALAAKLLERFLLTNGILEPGR